MKTNNLLALFKVSVLSASILNADVFAQVPDYSTDVIGMSEVQLSPNHWVDKLTQDTTRLMTQTSITQFNQNLMQNNPHIVDPLAMDDRLSKAELLEKIRSISKPSKHNVFMIMANSSIKTTMLLILKVPIKMLSKPTIQ